jgi:hypothetical protein
MSQCIILRLIWNHLNEINIDCPVEIDCLNPAGQLCTRMRSGGRVCKHSRYVGVGRCSRFLLRSELFIFFLSLNTWLYTDFDLWQYIIWGMYVAYARKLPLIQNQILQCRYPPIFHCPPRHRITKLGNRIMYTTRWAKILDLFVYYMVDKCSYQFVIIMSHLRTERVCINFKWQENVVNLLWLPFHWRIIWSFIVYREEICRARKRFTYLRINRKKSSQIFLRLSWPYLVECRNHNGTLVRLQ